jgi:hypothetical protein
MFREIRAVSVGDRIPLRTQLTESVTGQSLAIDLL